MDVAEMTSILVLITLLSVAVIQDMRSMKVSNRLILVGICAAIPLRIWSQGVGGIVWILPNIIIPVIVLYLFYLAGIMGAADIKLFSVIGSFVNLRELFYCIVVSFVLGAIFSLLKMVKNRNLYGRIFLGICYISDVVHGDIKAYEQQEEENIIHFSLAIFIGVIVVKMYEILI